VSRRVYILINAICLALLLASIATAVINWSKTESTELFPPSCYPYRFHIEQDFDITRLDEGRDFAFALVPRNARLDTLEILINNDAPSYSYISFRQYPTGERRTEKYNRPHCGVPDPLAD